MPDFNNPFPNLQGITPQQFQQQFNEASGGASDQDEIMRKARMEALRRMSQPKPDGRPMPGVNQQDHRLSQG
jgi:hypothetical protein